MATDAQHINTPSVEELIFLLSNSIKADTSPRGVVMLELPSSDWIPPRHLWNKFLRLLAIPAADHSAATIWIDSEQKPTLFICSDNPSFAEYVTGVIKLLQQVEASGSDSDRSDAAQQLITHVLFRLLDAHAVQYGMLLDKLRTTEARIPPENATLRQAIEIWRKGLTYALGVYGNFPNTGMPLPAHDDGINYTTEFLSWARGLSSAPPGSQGAFFAHIKRYKIQDSSALDLVKSLKENIVHPLVSLISRNGGKSKSPDVLPLKTLEVKLLDAENPADHIINPQRLKYWLSTLTYSAAHDSRASQTVLDRVINTETVDEQWTKDLGEGRIHPEATILAHIINTRLAPSEHSRGTFHPIVACTRASCIACVLCYKATAQAYDLPSPPLPFSIEGQMTTFRPCRVPPLGPVVEDKLKKALSESIRTIVCGEIMRQIIPEVKHGDEAKKAVRERLTAVTKDPWSKASGPN